MKVLLVTNQLPGHDVGFQRSGHAQYIGSFLEHFVRRGDRVTLIVFRPTVDFLRLPARRLNFQVIGPSLANVGASLFVRSPSAIATFLAWNVFRRLPQRWQAAADSARLRLRRSRGGVHHLGRFLTGKEVAFVRATLVAVKPDLIVYDGIFNSCGRIGALEHWLIAQDVKHQRSASFGQNGADVTASTVTSDAEGAVLSDVDTIVAIHDEDARELRRLAPGARIVVVPATIGSPQLRPAPEVPGKCVFVGSGSFHNYDGIKWFLDDCWPRVRSAIPTATLEIFGSVCYRLGELPPGVSLRGVVDDIAQAYGSAAVTIVPLRIGSGLKVKVVEAFAHGQAVVTTPVGAQGLLDLLPRPFDLAEPSGFACATISLLKSSERRLDLRAAASHCAESFTPEAAFARLDEALMAGPAS